MADAPTADAALDPAFPRLHGRPPTGWLNDPNGCSRIDGTWHVFYQYNPSEPVHGDIHWGHMSSPDLLRWRTEPVALAPRPGGPDAGGCWSGTLVDDDGVPTAVYTGIDSGGEPRTLLARTDRTVRTFTRDEPPVAGRPQDPSITDVRDPFLLTLDGRRYAVQGAGTAGGTARVLVYACDDLTSWTEVGTLLRADDPRLGEEVLADIWECPSLVRVDGVWVLLVSVWRLVDGRHSLHEVVWVTGDLTADGDGLTLAPTASGVLDTGGAYYAAQALAVDGRVLVWGWSWETDSGSRRFGAAPWQGVLTYPRELGVRDGRVVVRAAAELEGLRRGPADAGRLPAAFEVVAPPGARFGLTLDGAPCWPVGTAVTRVQVDGSLVEAFLDDGRTRTSRAYPVPGSRWELVGAPQDLAELELYALGLE